MLADHHPRIEIVIEPGAGSHAAFRGFDRHPIAVADTTRFGGGGMKLHLWIEPAFAQARQGAVLGLAEQR